MHDLAWTYLVRTIPADGLSIDRSADPAERDGLATAFELKACEQLDAHFTIKPQPQGRYRVAGSIRAIFEQSCVVTLEPMPQKLSFDFTRDFWPPGTVPVATEAEIETLEDEPDEIEEGAIDIGRIVVEELADRIDPYPRKAGAALDWQPAEDDAGSGPFAALKRLSRRDSDEGAGN